MLRQILIALGALAFLASAQTRDSAAAFETAPAASVHAALMDKLTGHWVLTGEIAGQSTVHDVDAEWVLQGNYVRLTETARERGANGAPLYEATVFVGWLESAHHYVCLWLDNTEVASGEVTCVAAETAAALPFEFRDAHGALMFTTTFVYHAESDSWDWRMDNIRNGAPTPFARVHLVRR